MDGKILDLFMKENDAWDDLISRQCKEIPQLEQMISTIFSRKKNIDEDVTASMDLLRIEMHLQQSQMSEIRQHLAQQQDLLAVERKGDRYPVQTLMSQNALRERIRDAERKFLDLKCNYLNYLASAV